MCQLVQKYEQVDNEHGFEARGGEVERIRRGLTYCHLATSGEMFYTLFVVTFRATTQAKAVTCTHCADTEGRNISTGFVGDQHIVIRRSKCRLFGKLKRILVRPEREKC